MTLQPGKLTVLQENTTLLLLSNSLFLLVFGILLLFGTYVHFGLCYCYYYNILLEEPLPVPLHHSTIIQLYSANNGELLLDRAAVEHNVHCYMLLNCMILLLPLTAARSEQQII